MTESISRVIISAENHIKQLREQFEDGESCSKPSDISLLEFNSKLQDAVNELFNISTRMTWLYTRSPYPNVTDTQDLMNSTEALVNNLVSVYNLLPKDQGLYFHNDVNKIVKKILEVLPDFIHSLANNKGPKNQSDLIKNAEIVFSACAEVEKMPKNNLESILVILQNEDLLLLDAIQEIDEEVKNDFSVQKSGEEIDNTEVWNNQDRELLPACVCLVKTARFCLKKIIASVKSNGDCSTIDNIQELDNLASIVEDLSPAIDIFVATIYPPMDQTVVKQYARAVVNVVQNLLNQNQCSHFIKEADQKWVNLLLKSVDHDNNRLQPLLSTEDGEDRDEDL